MLWVRTSLQGLICLLLFLQNLNAQIKTTKVPSWVIKQSYETQGQNEELESGYLFLLLNEQEKYADKHQYFEYAYKILNTEGIQEMSDISISFDPSYENIEFHSIKIIRSNIEINQIPENFNIIQRETSAERHLYDGSKTVLINLNDVRVGDIIQYSFSRKGYNPIFDNFIAGTYTLKYNSPVLKMYKRILIPKKYNLTWKKDNTAIAVQEKIIGNEVEYSILLDNVDAIMYDNNEPDWFDLTPRIHFTSFKNWKEVIDWALPSYSIDSNTQNEIESLISKDSKNLNLDDFLSWSIRFVQDEIRYLGFESGLNAYKPHNPIKVFKQRFGDCKDKSLLLVSFLKTRGIDAFPVLVNTRLRKETKNRLPSFFQFDHCIVGFYKDDKLYFIDPTINNQGGNWDSRYISDYGYGLFISNNFNDLSEIAQLKGGEINETQEIEIAGLEGEAMMRVVTVYTGHEADYQRSYFQSNSKEKILKQYITYYGNLYSDIEKFEDITFTDDRVKNIFTITEKYKIPTFWKPYNEDGSIVYCEFYPITLETYFNVSKSTSKKSPYQISYPVSYSHTIHVTLHDNWNIEPSKISIENEFYKYNYDVSYDGDKSLTLSTTYKTLASAIPEINLNQFIEDHTKMMNNLSYKLQFNKSIQKSIDENIGGIIVTTITLLLVAFGCIKIYTLYNPELLIENPSNEPIGGWLILLGIGVCFTPIRFLYQFSNDITLLNGEIWYSQFLTKEYTLGLIVLLEHIYNLTHFLFSVLLCVIFIQRRTSFPMLMKINLAVAALFIIFQSLVIYTLNNESEIEIREVVQSIFQAAIWIPYLHLSERVKNTFVKRA